jgi:hypothetical protein
VLRLLKNGRLNASEREPYVSEVALYRLALALLNGAFPFLSKPKTKAYFVARNAHKSLDARDANKNRDLIFTKATLHGIP